MKYFVNILLISALSFSVCFGQLRKNSRKNQAGYEPLDKVAASQSDSAYLFVYCLEENEGRDGMFFAWSNDGKTWREIGPKYKFVGSDFGTWGAEKQMHSPSVRRIANGNFEVLWNVHREGGEVAYTVTSDFIHWKPQDYYKKSISDYFINDKVTLYLPMSGIVDGEIIRVEWKIVQDMINECTVQTTQAKINSERAIDDAVRFKDLKQQNINIVVDESDKKAISDKLIGIFFEDISYAADGGLYAEMIQNRDFEFSTNDKKTWGPTYAWTAENMELSIDSVAPLTTQNLHYAVLKTEDGQGSLSNNGFDGIVMKKGEKYDFSIFGRVIEGKGNFVVLILSPDNKVLGAGSVYFPDSIAWTQQTTVIQSLADCDNAHLSIMPMEKGIYHVDMISLFPQDTYKGRKNGLRKDLAEKLADLKPKFVRFPGGCVAHGNGLDNIYRWKNTVGPLESRKPDFNIWHYHQTFGLGYYEYFQMCEDFGAEPLPVLAAGVPCQNSSHGGDGQMGGIPMEKMGEYIQDILDLIEWANGDPETNEWAKMRADAGHPEPFNLKYLGIGNEDLISDVFIERFKMIYDAVTAAYPEIIVVGTVGPFYQGSDYEEGWRLARKLNIPIVDEHYYESPGWFMNHQDFYDRYQRGGTKVYLGEYAAHIPGRANCLETALAEALYLCSVERNGDVVEMTSYAPLFSKKGHSNWDPDMIYFDNTSISLTTGYQVQKLFGNYAGDEYIGSSVRLTTPDIDVLHRIGSSIVRDSKTGDIIVKIVNLLPVANSFEIEIPETSGKSIEAKLLTGQLEDKYLEPIDFNGISVTGNKMKFELPAYSFVVVRIK